MVCITTPPLVQAFERLFLIVQIVCDIIQSGGIIGGPYIRPDVHSEEPVEVFFCNPDLIWRSDFERPRLGQGAFKEAFQAVYKVRCHSRYD
jgi:ribonucleotide monophosphatase NagD (HAD superfamily)